MQTAPSYSRTSTAVTPAANGRFARGNAFQGSRAKPAPPVRRTQVNQEIDAMLGKNAGVLSVLQQSARRYHNVKLAAVLGDPGMVSNAVSNTAGRVLGAVEPVNWLVAGTDQFRSPRKDELRQQQHTAIMEALNNSRADALSDTELRLGAPNMWQDLVWKPERGQSLPWYKQLGGRVLHNQRTGPLGKLLGYPLTAIGDPLMSLMRAPHYNPYTDVAHNPMHRPAITGHELGHAIDFNSLTNNGKVPKTLLGRLGSGTLRDLYDLAYKLPFVNLYHENEANRESEQALVEGMRSKPQLLKHVEERAKTLPAGYGSYMGGHAGRLFGPAGAVAGPIIGAAVGSSIGHTPHYVRGKVQDAERRWDATHASKDDSKGKPKAKPEAEEKEASFAVKLAMKPLLALTVRRLTIQRRPSRMPSVRASDNKTPSTNDMAKSKDAKGEFQVE